MWLFILRGFALAIMAMLWVFVALALTITELINQWRGAPVVQYVDRKRDTDRI
jgi:hypothetical protein